MIIMHLRAIINKLRKLVAGQRADISRGVCPGKSPLARNYIIYSLKKRKDTLFFEFFAVILHFGF
ncbi:MAG: hypothetical protein AUK39_04355 [Dehalococcoidia bacterium CG2_30_46_19]|nr:MAG: hypothetical protein AUK39_04355 [Dehalococcoidia bacterium CG2_30_46_19]